MDLDKFVDDVKNGREPEEAKKENPKEEYLKTSAKYSLENFINGLSEDAETPFIPTNFKKLDNALEGGLYEGLHIIGAISSLGKTTFALQIADSIAYYGLGEQHVLIFSLEMGTNELIAKSLSRTTAEIDLLEHKTTEHAKTTRGITVKKFYRYYSDLEKKIIDGAIDIYKTYANNIFINEGIGNIGVKEIREAVKKHIEITGVKPVVIIDYLQCLAPNKYNNSDKQNVDNNVTELRRMCRDFKIIAIAISSFNRENYNTKASMQAFKESGSIEYGADVLLALQLKGVEDSNFDVDKAKAKEKRDVELKILKQRSGRVGDTIDFSYYAKFNLFIEDQEEKALPEGVTKVESKRDRERRLLREAFNNTKDNEEMSSLSDMAEYLDVTRSSSVKKMINEYGGYKVDAKTGIVTIDEDFHEAYRKSETPYANDRNYKFDKP